MLCFKGLITASAPRLEKEQEGYYLKNGSEVLEELLTLCDGNCRIPLRYFSAAEIERATEQSEQKIEVHGSYMLSGSLDNRLVLVRFFRSGANISKEISRDIAVTAQMSHLKNVLKLIGCCLEFKHPVMVYEYAEAVTLAALLFKKKAASGEAESLPGINSTQRVCWERRLEIASDIASAVVYLHSEFKTPIIHRDLKALKVMIDKKSGVAKLFDFSFSISLPPGELQVEEKVHGTFGYIDPEYVQSGIITQKTDVFSFGVILLELLAGNSIQNIWNNMQYKFEDFTSLESTIGQCDVMDMVDPVILEEHGTGIHQQFEDYFDLVKKCTSPLGEDRPYMIDVARDLRRIHKCFLAVSPAQA